MRPLFWLGEGRRRRYIGVFGCRYSFSEGSEDVKSSEVKGIGCWAVRVSSEIVMGRAKRDRSDVKLLKAVCRSEEAVRKCQ